MSGRRSKVVWASALAVILVAGFLGYRLLSPEGREAIDHYQCLRREEPKAEAVASLIGSTLKEGQATRNDVRHFIKQTFAELPIIESEAEISAGHMYFSFDQGGTLTRVTQEIPCPISLRYLPSERIGQQ